MEPLSESTKLHQICLEKLSHTSLSDILQENQLENSSLKEDMVKSTDKESLSHQTQSLLNHLQNTVLTMFKIWSIKSTLLDLTSKRLTTSFGHSSLEDQEEDSLTRDILSKEEEIGETEKNTLTNWSPRCFDSYLNHHKKNLIMRSSLHLQT